MEVVIRDDGTSLQSLLEQLPEPVLVVDDDIAVVTGNTVAQRALGKSVISIRGYRGGDIITCEEAAKPGGCGKQQKCKGCVIRNSVNHTHRTGEPVTGAVAEQRILRDGRYVEQRFRISTARRGDVVLLRVDEVKG